MKRKSNGTFAKKHKLWSLNNFNEGYVRKKDNRFFVYLPNHKRASASGFVLRSIVAYEKYHNETITIEFDIHHKDKNRLNDSKENLEKIKHTDHSVLHNEHKKNGNIYTCYICSNLFYVPMWRENDRKRHMNKNYVPKYCSKECYKKRIIIPEGLINDFNNGFSLRELEKKYKISRPVLSRELQYV